jgi:ribosomal subunit interface protein
VQTPLQITFRNLPHSNALEERIREKLTHLEQHHPRVSACRVTVEEVDRHKHQGKQFRVSLTIQVPGHELVVNHHQNEDPYVVLRDVFAAAGRQLNDLARERRGKNGQAGFEMGRAARREHRRSPSDPPGARDE